VSNGEPKPERESIENKDKRKKQEKRIEQDKLERQKKRGDIETLLKEYDSINYKVNAIIPLLSEVLSLAVNFDTNVKYEPQLKYRFRIKWIVQIILVAYSQIQKLSEYMKLVNNRRQDVIAEFTEEQENTFE
jgi:hypothetical protein